MTTYAIDIDGVLCKTKGSDYLHSIPNYEVIRAVNLLYEQGHTIKIFTGRGVVSKMNWLATTEKQLEQWGVKYHALIMGKTHFDICLDDKMITVSELLRDETLENCVVAEIVKAFKSGHKVLVCGNGGLAAESSHFVAELVGKFGGDTYLPAISLVENPALITAISNDFGYQMVFSHQISVLGNSGDILIAMTTSQSSNIYDAIIAGRKNKLITVSITGLKSKNMDSHYQFRMYGDDTAEIQNETIKFLHRIAFEVKRVYGK